MVGVVGPCICDVLKNLGSRKPKSLGYGKQALWAECALCVDIQTLALSTTLVDGQLACDCQHVAQLRLASSELAWELRERIWWWVLFQSRKLTKHLCD